MLDGTNGSKRDMLKGYKGGGSNMGDTPVGYRGMVKSSSISVPGESKRCVSNVSKGGVPKSPKEGVPNKGFKKSVPPNRLGE